jgi:hypothetical protein
VFGRINTRIARKNENFGRIVPSSEKLCRNIFRILTDLFIILIESGLLSRKWTLKNEIVLVKIPTALSFGGALETINRKPRLIASNAKWLIYEINSRIAR